MHKYDQTIVKQACEMYEATDERGRRIGVQAICRELGLHAPDLYAILAQESIPMRRTRPSSGKGSRIKKTYDDKVIELIVAMAERGMTAKDIARATVIPYQHILLVCKNEGVQLFRGRRMVSEDEAEVLRMIDSGMTIEGAAAEKGLSTADVMDILARSHPTLRGVDLDVALADEQKIASMTAEVLRRVQEQLKQQ